MNASPPGTDLRRPSPNTFEAFAKGFQETIAAWKRGAQKARCRAFNEAIRKELESWN